MATQSQRILDYFFAGQTIAEIMVAFGLTEAQVVAVVGDPTIDPTAPVGPAGPAGPTGPPGIVDGVLTIPDHGGGVRLTSPDGTTTKTITIDNTGALAIA